MQIKQTQLCKLRDVQLQAARTKGVAQRILLALRTRDPQRLEQTGHQIIHERHPGLALDEDPQQIRTGIVVLEHRARLVNDLGVQDEFHPVLLHHLGAHRTHQHRVFKPHRHRDEMAELHLFQVFGGFRRGVGGKVIQHRIVQREQPFLNGKGAGRRGEALCAGILVLPLFRLRLIACDQRTILIDPHSADGQLFVLHRRGKGSQIQCFHNHISFFQSIRRG